MRLCTKVLSIYLRTAATTRITAPRPPASRRRDAHRRRRRASRGRWHRAARSAPARQRSSCRARSAPASARARAAAPGVDERARLAGEEALDVLLQPGKERRIERGAMLDHLGKARAQLALGQRIERRHVADHGERLVEGADHVLAARMVDGGLAADGRVDLREQRGRYLHEAHAALVDRRGKAGEVADDAAAKSDDGSVAAEARREQFLKNAVERGPALRALAILHDDFGDARAR